MNNAVALVTENEELSYGDMLEAADGIAATVDERSVVFLFASNSIEAVCGYVGFLRKHAVATMIRPDLPWAQLSQLIDTYTPQYLWIPTSYLEENPVPGTSQYSYRDYQLVRLDNPAYEVNPDLALMLTTSGSTGSPKFVRLSYENLQANAESIAEYQQLTAEDRAITTLPFSYTYGISIVNSHLLRGASIALCDESIVSGGFWSFFDKVQPTNFGGVPYTYQMLDRLRFARRNTPSLRFISQAGGRLGVPLQEKFAQICADKEIEFFVMYGQTEATARVSWLPPEHVSDKLGSIGIAIPGGSLELRDLETGETIVDADVDGELIYRGANVSLGYATCRDDLAKPDERQGVLSTGDLARRDADGFYYITGRLKRFLKMFGSRVSLDELEKMLEAQGWIAAATGEDNHLLVFTTESDTNAVLDFIVANTGLHPSGLRITHLDEIPHTNAGKVDYQTLIKL